MNWDRRMYQLRMRRKRSMQHEIGWTVRVMIIRTFYWMTETFPILDASECLTTRGSTVTFRSLKQRQYISLTTYGLLKPPETHIAWLYDLPKIHKPGIPWRLILSILNSPYYSIAKWLVKITSTTSPWLS